ncbi:MAG: hypothetical protein AB7O97_01210 [Planctomycetota bacterium]
MTEFRELADRVGGVWFAHHRPATGTPDRIYGTGQPLPDWRGSSLAEARRHADAALLEHADLLGLGASEFRETIGARMGSCWSFTYAQSFRGLPVIGGRADVRIHENGVLAMLGSVAVPIDTGFDVTPAIDETTAALQAWLALGDRPTRARQPVPRVAPLLCIWADVDADARSSPHLAYEVHVSNVDADGNGRIGRCYVDARDGTLLRFVDDKHHCGCGRAHAGPGAAAHAARALPTPTTVTVMGWTRTAESAVAAPVNVPLAGCVLSVPGIGAVTTDQNGQFTIDITAPVTITVTNLDGVRCAPITPALPTPASVTVTPGVPATLQVLTAAATDVQLAHTNVLHWTTRTNEFARSVLGDTPQLDLLDTIQPHVNQAGACNAFYTGNTISFYLADAIGGCHNTAFSSIVAHECGHGLDDRYGGISNAPTDGLSEGWGDIVAMYLFDSPDVGLDFYTAPGSVLRSGDNTTPWGTQTEAHQSGESWMGFAWKVRQNLRTLLGTSAAVAISNQVVLGTIVANSTNQVDAALQVFLAADDDGNLLNGGPHYAALSGAAIAHGLPFPQQQIAFLSHTPLGDTTGQFGSRAVVARSFAVTSGAISQVQLTYTLPGGAPTAQAMVRDATADGYLGVLPGIQSGEVRYRIEAVHSSGYVVRSPAVGDHVFSVQPPAAGAFQRFYLEDFETGGLTWSDGRITGSNDWEIGGVAGNQGTAQGTFWTDPLFAASGQNAAGNSISGGSGEYRSDSSCWLRTPALNCSGQVGVHLRFQRWLSVQSAPFDRATIYVNGTQVWTNPTTGPVSDLSWTPVELAIPMADNNPSVVIEWRLTTNATVEFGGWAIDDVELGTHPAATQAPRLQMLPERVPPSGTVNLTFTGVPNTPLIFVAADAGGPVFLPGIGTAAISGNALASIFAFTDAAGLWTVSFPTAPLAASWMAYSQALSLDANGGIVLSNGHANLFLR